MVLGFFPAARNPLLYVLARIYREASFKPFLRAIVKVKFLIRWEVYYAS
jgi:hypothetical protein